VKKPKHRCSSIFSLQRRMIQTTVMFHIVGEPGEKDREYLSTRTADVVDKIEEIDAKIDEVAAGWKTKRMGKVELTILRLAVYEMLYDDTIPEKVSVNEAVELAKKFGGNESPAFVNGVLAKFIPKEEKKEESKEDQEA
jgi:N utilization substance protein B